MPLIVEMAEEGLKVAIVGCVFSLYCECLYLNDFTAAIFISPCVQPAFQMNSRF